MTTDAPSFPLPFRSAAQLLPHGESAVFIERIVEHDESGIACEVVPGKRDGALAENEVIPTELGIEYMAQAVAAYAGLREAVERRRDVGYVIAVRDLRVHTPGFVLGETLLVRATWQWGEANLARFSTSIERNGTLLASAFLSVFRPKHDTP